MKRYIWLFLVIISFCWITSGLSQFGNDPFQKSDTTGTVATQYDLTTGLALQLQRAAFDDSIRSTFRKVVYVRPGESIQAAFTSLTGLSATQYGAVVLLPGTHTITTKLEMRKYSALLGYGRGISILYSAADIIMVESDSSCIEINDLTIYSSANSHSVPTINITTTYNAGEELLPFEIRNCDVIGVDMSAGAGININGDPTYSNYLGSGSGIYNTTVRQSVQTTEAGIGICISNIGGALYTGTNYALHIQNVVIEKCYWGLQLSSVQSNFISLRNNYFVSLVTGSIALWVGNTSASPVLSSTIYVDGGRYDGAYYDIYMFGQVGYTTTAYLDVSGSTGVTLGNAYAAVNYAAINGENITNDTIDDDSIDLTDITLADFTDDVGYFKADGTVDLTGNINFTAAAPEITSANSLKIPAFEVIDSDTLNIGTGTDVIRIVKSGHQLSFITSDGNVYYTSVKNDSTQF
jgi:hypothetical protein